MTAGRLDVERELAGIGDMDLLRKPYVTAAYATGSLLAGFGTPTSDVDVVVLVATNADKELARQDKALRRHGSVRADFEVYTVDEFAGLVDSCADYRTTWETGQIYRVDHAMRLLSQFTAAVRVLKPSPELTALGKRIAALRQTLVRVSVTRAVIFGNNAHEDLLGLIQDNDDVGVYRRSHDLLEFGLDAWCTAKGAIYPNTKWKWLWRRVNLVLSGERELAGLRALYVPETATGPAADVASRRMDTTQALLAQALLAAWAPNPGFCRTPVLPRRTAPGETLWRSPAWMPTRTPDGWGLGAEFLFRQVSVPEFIAWACAGGHREAELRELVVDQCRGAYGADIRPATARAAIRGLLGWGAIRAGSCPSAGTDR